MPNIARGTFRGSELPHRLAVQITEGTEDDVYLVEARRLSAEDAAKLEALRSDLKVGLEQLELGEGRPLDLESLLDRLHAQRDAQNG